MGITIVFSPWSWCTTTSWLVSAIAPNRDLVYPSSKPEKWELRVGVSRKSIYIIYTQWKAPYLPPTLEFYCTSKSHSDPLGDGSDGSKFRSSWSRMFEGLLLARRATRLSKSMSWWRFQWLNWTNPGVTTFPMEEILQRLRYMKPDCKNGRFSISTGAGFISSTLLQMTTTNKDSPSGQYWNRVLLLRGFVRSCD